MNDAVSSNDVIEGMKEKIGELIYENAILRAQALQYKRKIADLESRDQAENS